MRRGSSPSERRRASPPRHSVGVGCARGLPIFIGLWIYKFNRGYMSLLLHTTGGLFMLGAAGVLMVAGYLWMRKIVAIDV